MAVLAVKVSVICSGKDVHGKPFEETTRTTLIEEDGGRFLTSLNLTPQNAITIRLAARKSRSIEARVESQTAASSGAHEWQFRFLAPEPDFWGVRFPTSAAQPAAAAAAAPGATAVPAASAAALMSGPAEAVARLNEELILLSQHADDHVKYCRDEISGVRDMKVMALGISFLAASS